MKNIIHIITGLENGETEEMLYKLLKYNNRELYNMKVISLMDKNNRRIRNTCLYS